MSNPSQLLLLADHIKLSLLERQRAISLNLDPNPSTDSNISRSLESFREGIESLASRSSDTEQLSLLRSQYADLSRQFHGPDASTSTSLPTTLTSPNDPSLKDDFTHAQTRRSTDNNTSGPGQKPRTTTGTTRSKNVRFRDNPSQESLTSDPEDTANRAALFPSKYSDAVDGGESRSSGAPPPDPTADMSNTQIHQYHAQILEEQDSQLDRLGESIGRQRHLAMQVGDELEGQIALLDEVDRGVDRHQGRLDGAKRRLVGVGKKASQNWGMTTIIVLIVILVLLIVVLK